MTAPTHMIMVVNRETCELKLISAHSEKEAEAAFQNMAAVLAATPNDVHKVAVPGACGFVIGEIVSKQGAQPRSPQKTDVAALGGSLASAKNGVQRNDQGEYVKTLPDGSELISSSDFGDD